MSKTGQKKDIHPPQQQEHQPGRESVMRPPPRPGPKGDTLGPRLRDRVAIITGGDSGIGRAVAVAFARHGAHVVLAYLEEETDAAETARMVEAEDRRALRLAGDIGDRAFCRRVVAAAVDEFGRLDVVVNNAAEQHETARFEDIDLDQVERTFRTNILSMFALTKFALPHLQAGASVINTTSVTAYRGHTSLIDYASTKAAIVGFTRALALHLAPRQIRVNAVAPGPIWTPLIPASFGPEKVASFGTDTPLGRPGQPEEVAPCYVFLASDEASYMTGQVLHPNGGEVVNA